MAVTTDLPGCTWVRARRGWLIRCAQDRPVRISSVYTCHVTDRKGRVTLVAARCVSIDHRTGAAILRPVNPQHGSETT